MQDQHDPGHERLDEYDGFIAAPEPVLVMRGPVNYVTFGILIF